MGLTLAEKQRRRYVVYFLRCPITGMVRYIGCSSNPEARAISHTNSLDGMPEKRSWVERLKAAGLRFILEVKTPPMSYAAASHLEMRLIALYAIHTPNQLFNGHIAKDGLLRKVSGLRFRRYQDACTNASLGLLSPEASA